MRLMLKGVLVLALIALFASSAFAEVTVINKGAEELVVSGQLQFRGMVQENDDDGYKHDDSFRLRRARVQLKGKLGNNFSFKVKGEFAPDQVALKDGFVMWTDDPGRFWIRGGQFKVPFGYEENTSSSRLYTMDRSLASDALTPSREIGMEMGGVFGVEDAFNWSLGVFNGNGEFAESDNNDPALVAGKLTWGHEDEVLVGVNALKNVEGGGTSGMRRTRYTGLGAFGGTRFGPDDDWLFRGEYIWMNIEDDPTDTDYDSWGWWALLGYYFDDQCMGVLKGEQYDVGSELVDDKINQFTVGINWFLIGRGEREHDEKFQIEYVYTDEEGSDLDNNKIQAQMQLLF